MTTPEEEEQPERVRVVRDSSGRVVGFQDPDFGNRFITRDEALSRLRYDSGKSQILDSFGNPVEVGALHYTVSHAPVAFINGVWEYRGIGQDPSRARPGASQEVVEQTTVINKDGTLTTIEISGGAGKRWQENKSGGKWRYEMSKALGLGKDEKLPTTDLTRFVVRKDYFIRTTEIG